MAEAAVGALAGAVGRVRARELVDQAARGGRRRRPPAAGHAAGGAGGRGRHLGPAGVEAGPSTPSRYLGSAQALIDRALAAHR